MAIVDFIRVSAGTAAVLNLNSMEIDAPPTTAYLMMDHKGKCSANCSFCPQSRSTEGKEAHLSRITWPRFPLPVVAQSIARAFSDPALFRACIQTLNYPALVPELIEVVRGIRDASTIPISVAIHPIPPEKFQELKDAGVGRVGIALDGCTRKIFDQVKGEGVRGPYNWEGHLASIKTAQNVFGTGNVATHFVVGLGETEQEMLQAIQDIHDLGVTVSLFAFTPVKGTAEQSRGQPPLAQYRKMQLGRELVVNWEKRMESFVFSPDGELEAFNISEDEFRDIMDAGTAFETRGCPSCNRPYYDSHPGGTIYNFAALLTEEQKLEVQNILEPFR